MDYELYTDIETIIEAGDEFGEVKNNIIQLLIDRDINFDPFYFSDDIDRIYTEAHKHGRGKRWFIKQCYTIAERLIGRESENLKPNKNQGSLF